MPCCILCCLPASQADLTRFRRLIVLWVSTAKRNFRFKRWALRKSVCSLVFLSAVETHKTISRRNRVRSACEAGKQPRIQHGNRVSRFYSQNIRIIDFSSKAVAFPYKPLQIQTVVTQYLHML